jgi:hypothetical protein
MSRIEDTRLVQMHEPRRHLSSTVLFLCGGFAVDVLATLYPFCLGTLPL